MKTTVDLPDDLYRRVKSEAALRGLEVRDLVEEGLRLALDAQRRADRKPTVADLTEPARGMIDSGVPDLGSNPRHLAGFGRDALRRSDQAPVRPAPAPADTGRRALS